ncbi:FHA domain-containing protein [Nocardioides seonyuensis]|uniref:FHA domain-containing protein n=1 Tax=Nocardioides seonyuensis TaxID=2518371 RepID=A0A4P7ICG3_9ACTN|nr:FHA domain-containing protein [Nocardioides seonyuensis]
MSLPPTPRPYGPRPDWQPPLTQLPVAQLERRFQAFAIDRLFSWGIPALVGVLTWVALGDEPWSIVAAVVIALVVVWLAMAIAIGVNGSSPGKAARGLRVVHHGTGTPIGAGPALVRSLVLALSGLPTFGIGVATLAWTAVEDRGSQRRGWHDHLAGSVVVDVRPAPEVQEEGQQDAPRHIVNLTAMRLVPAPPVEALVPPTRSVEHSMRRQAPAQSVPRPMPQSAPQPTSPPMPQPAPQHAAPPPMSAPMPAPMQVPPSAPRHAAPPPASQHLAPGSPPAPRWRVRFDDGQSFTVDGVVLVGRRPEPRAGEDVSRLVPLASADMSVSKTHAQFGPAADGALVVMDRGSTNGSTLVRQGVSRQLSPGRAATLVDGDTVVFGDRHMVVSREG